MFQCLKEWLLRGLRPTRWCGQTPEPSECLISGHLFTTTSPIYQVWPLALFFVCVFLAKKSPIDHQLAMTVLSSVPSNDSPAVSPRKIFLRGWGCHTHTSPLMTLPELEKSKVLSLLWPELRYFSSNKRESWAQHFQQRHDCVIFAILRRPLNHWRW